MAIKNYDAARAMVTERFGESNLPAMEAFIRYIEAAKTFHEGASEENMALKIQAWTNVCDNFCAGDPDVMKFHVAIMHLI